MNPDEKNLVQARLLIEELRRHGVTRFVICPGSRSSALALALSRDERAEGIVHHDERGAGYYAVGYARASGRPAAIVTTSGTAAVNLYPAVVEASQDNLPLIALTADRPPELHGRGSNQTIDQQGLFGGFVRRFVNLPCPEEQEPRDLLEAVDRACHPEVPGPVHFNCMYREPLVPPPDEVRPIHEIIASIHPELSTWLGSSAPLHQKATGRTTPGEPWSETAPLVRTSRRGLLLIGELRSDNEQRAATALAGTLGWPTLCDVTSGLSAARCASSVAHYDLILSSDRFRTAHAPDAVVHVGGRITSKRLLTFLEKVRPAHYLFNAGHGIVYDPVGAVTQKFSVDTAVFCRRLADEVGASSPDPSWCETWARASERARSLVAGPCGGPTWTEPSLAYTLSRLIGDRAGLFVASSMPIRDLDACAAFDPALRVGANRGASGIDGTIASAAGFADGLERPVTLLIGDQAFLHDLSSLPLLGAIRQPVTTVVINNGGGRIFEMLPIARHRAALDRFFVNSRSFGLEQVAAAFGLACRRPGDIGAFQADYDSALASGKPAIIEVMVDPAASLEQRRSLTEQVCSAVDGLV